MRRFLKISITAASRDVMSAMTGFTRRLAGVTVCLFALAAVGTAQVSQAWVARYDGLMADTATELAVDTAGNTYVTGRSFGNNNNDYLTIKYDSLGNPVWASRYNGPANGGDVPYGIAVDPGGNVFVTGESYGGTSNADYATVKYDSNGNELWVRRYDGTGNFWDVPAGLALDTAGNVIVAGSSVNAAFDTDFVTIKYDPSGNPLWVSRLPWSEEQFASAIAVDSSGHVYVTGRTFDFNQGIDLFLTVKHDPNGNILWTQFYDGPAQGFDASIAIAVDMLGNVYVVGGSENATNLDYATVKYDLNGNQLWVARYDGNSNDYANALAVDAAGNVFVTGTSYAAGTNFDYATIKYDSNGNQLWLARYNGPGNGIDDGNALAVDAAGNVYVTGRSNGAGTNFDYATVKYDSNGNLRWQARSDGQGNAYADSAYGLALDATGNVYVTGTSGNAAGNPDYLTIKYSQAIICWPSGYTLGRGTLISGNLNSLVDSDNDRLVMRPGVVFSSQEPPIQLIVEASAPDDTLSRLEFSVEAHCSVSNIEQRIALYNYDTQAYETLNTSTATTSDSTTVVAVTSNPARFVGPNLEMRSRVSYKAQGPTFVYPWFARVDQVKWTLTD